MKKRVAIIGGGIVGLATGYRLLQANPKITVDLFEKESGVGQHQSSHNSGVLHCGLYYKPGSLKAQLAVAGSRQMIAFCQEHQIPYEICGKLVVATDQEEQARLLKLQDRGLANGLKGIRYLHRAQMLEIEPHAGGLAALHIPEEGIVDFPRVCAVLAEQIIQRGGRLHLGTKITKMERAKGEWIIQSQTGAYAADFLLNCAGLQADRVAEQAGVPREVRIIPFRGEYFTIRPSRRFLVKHLIYPVPDLHFPFLGVHFTRTIGGAIEAGPNAVLALKREGYQKGDFHLKDAIDALSFPGFWKFLRKHRSMCWAEIQRSSRKEIFFRSLQRLLPGITLADLVSGGAGVRAQAMDAKGELLQDFHLLRQPNALHVLNAPSPAATASLAIAQHIIDQSGLGAC